MEIYVNSAERDVHLDFPLTPTATDAFVYDGEELLYEATTITIDNGLTFTLPFSIVTKARSLRIHWVVTYVENSETETFEQDTYVDIVVPLVTVAQIRDNLEIGDEYTDEQLTRAESQVRGQIENITGQRFYAYTATLPATELPDGSIRLPQKMVTLVSVGGVAYDLYYVLANTGWRLAISYPRKRDGIRAGEVPIVDPFAKYRAGSVSIVMVTGLWGYTAVPQDIQQAALILIEQKLCPDALYAERYIKTMTAADMRFEFNPGAYVGTGNVLADQILAKYTASAMAVI